MKGSLFLDWLKDPRWDEPFFKVLSANDTGASRGHQGGFVVPKPLRVYFPQLDESQISSFSPTADRRILASLYDGTLFRGDALVRYQVQTWGGRRSSESRITDNLGPIRESAQGGDVMLMQRKADSLDQYRLVLVRQGTSEYKAIHSSMTAGWGTLFGVPPVTSTDLSDALEEIEEAVDNPFSIATGEPKRKESKSQRIARCAVFPVRIRSEYGSTCCVSGIAMATPNGHCEVEAAHVVPLRSGGTDDLRNGIALTSTLHWAFDEGLFGVTPSRSVHVPARVLAMPQNAFLRQFAGKPISEAKTGRCRAHEDALAWHYEHVVSRWE